MPPSDASARRLRHNHPLQRTARASSLTLASQLSGRPLNGFTLCRRMRRLRRILVNGFTVLSLVLMVLVAALWVRSYRFTDALFWESAGRGHALSTARGRLVWNWNWNPPSTAPARQPRRRFDYHRMQPYTAPTYASAYGSFQLGDTFPQWQFAGLNWYGVRSAGGIRSATGVMPLAYLAAATALLPTSMALRQARSFLRSTRAHRRNVCHSCGYDLRATPERCPECGAMPPPARAA